MQFFALLICLVCSSWKVKCVKTNRNQVKVRWSWIGAGRPLFCQHLSDFLPRRSHLAACGIIFLFPYCADFFFFLLNCVNIFLFLLLNWGDGFLFLWSLNCLMFLKNTLNIEDLKNIWQSVNFILQWQWASKWYFVFLFSTEFSFLEMILFMTNLSWLSRIPNSTFLLLLAMNIVVIILPSIVMREYHDDDRDAQEHLPWGSHCLSSRLPGCLLQYQAHPWRKVVTITIPFTTATITIISMIICIIFSFWDWTNESTESSDYYYQY